MEPPLLTVTRKALPPEPTSTRPPLRTAMSEADSPAEIQSVRPLVTVVRPLLSGLGRSLVFQPMTFIKVTSFMVSRSTNPAGAGPKASAPCGAGPSPAFQSPGSPRLGSLFQVPRLVLPLSMEKNAVAFEPETPGVRSRSGWPPAPYA